MVRAISIPDFCKDMEKYFGTTNNNKFLDANLMLCTGRVELDLFALDAYLHEKHGNYEDDDPDGVSMREFITRTYGAAAAAYVAQYLS